MAGKLVKRLENSLTLADTRASTLLQPTLQNVRCAKLSLWRPPWDFSTIF